MSRATHFVAIFSLTAFTGCEPPFPHKCFNTSRATVALASTTVSTLAGNGNCGSADGTGGANGTAEFCFPEGLALDVQGNVYVSDNNKLIRKIDPAGNVTTFAGGGSDDGDGPDGVGETAVFDSPQGLAMAPDGTLYVAERDGAIRKVDPNRRVSTLLLSGGNCFIFGEGPCGPYSSLTGIAADLDGTLIVPDAVHNRVDRIDPTAVHIGQPDTGVTIISGDGTGQGIFERPSAVVVDADGNILVSEARGIQRIDKSGNTAWLEQYLLRCNSEIGNTSHGWSASSLYRLASYPAVDLDGFIYGSADNDGVFRSNFDGNHLWLGGNGPGFVDGPPDKALFNKPRGVAVAPNGRVYIADSANHRIRVIEKPQ